MCELSEILILSNSFTCFRKLYIEDYGSGGEAEEGTAREEHRHPTGGGSEEIHPAEN